MKVSAYALTLQLVITHPLTPQKIRQGKYSFAAGFWSWRCWKCPHSECVKWVEAKNLQGNPQRATVMRCHDL